jgi:bidirectional [NiFe] hydrogenase diaphorase subunit
MRTHQFRPDALLEVLHTAQEQFGYLPEHVLRFVGRGLRLPPSRVRGVASFYHFFSFTPPAAHTCVVCRGTACYVQGVAAVQTALEAALGVRSGQTRPDGKAALATARCLGACGLAPLVVFDQQVTGAVTPERARERVKGWLDDGFR